MILTVEKRNRSLGEPFYYFTDELADITFKVTIQALLDININDYKF